MVPPALKVCLFNAKLLKPHYNKKFLTGGSVAKLLLQYPEQYTVRCLTRTPESEKAQSLAKLGAEVVQGNLSVPSTLPEVVKGAWGIFAVTDFYDTVWTLLQVFTGIACA